MDKNKETGTWPPRFVTDKKGKQTDLYSRAFLTIRSAEASGSFLFQGRLKKELLQCMEELGLTLEQIPEELTEEWKVFAKDYIEACLRSRAYGSTLFGMVPMREDGVSLKLAEDLQVILFDYPRRFQLEDGFLPLRRIFREEFLSQVKDGEALWPE